MLPSPFRLNIMIPYKEQDWLPGEGNGGMEQLESAGRVSMLVAAAGVPSPPVIIRPALESCVKYKDNTYICL